MEVGVFRELFSSEENHSRIKTILKQKKLVPAVPAKRVSIKWSAMKRKVLRYFHLQRVQVTEKRKYRQKKVGDVG